MNATIRPDQPPQQNAVRTVDSVRLGYAINSAMNRMECRLGKLEQQVTRLGHSIAAWPSDGVRHVVYVAGSPAAVPRIFLSMSTLISHADDWRGHCYCLYVTGAAGEPAALRRRCRAFSGLYQLAEAQPLEDAIAAEMEAAFLPQLPWPGLPLRSLLALPCARVLVLEAETLVCGDLSGLFELELNGHWGAAVKALQGHAETDPGTAAQQEPECRDDAAIEPGMLLLDLDALRHSAGDADAAAARPRSGLRLVHPRYNCRRPAAPWQAAHAGSAALICSGAQAGYAADAAAAPPVGALTEGARRRSRALLLAPGRDFDEEAAQLLGHEVIVSLTSMALRAPYIAPAVTSLLEQSFQRCRVVLWLAEEEFTPQSIPAELQALQGCERFEIRLCPDMGSYKKLIPALQAFPGAIICTADDDMLYHRHWLAELLLSWLEEPQAIHCHRPRQCLFDLQTLRILPYRHWPLVNVNQRSTFTTVIRGCSGVLYPPRSLPPAACSYTTARMLCPGADDLWFWAQAVTHGTRLRRVRDSTFEERKLIIYQNRSLFDVNKTANDQHLQRLWQALPQLRRRLLEECGISPAAAGSETGTS